MGKKLTPWQKIIRARNRGTGLRLTADEVQRLGSDEAIEARAACDDAGQDDPMYRPDDWAEICAKRQSKRRRK